MLSFLQMSDPKSPSKKVTFFQHFPHYFVRPYDAQILYTEEEFIDKLNAKNCEWMTRPKVAMSELAMAVTQNQKILEDNEAFSDSFMASVTNLLDPTLESFKRLDVKSKGQAATKQDIYKVLNSCFQHPEFDQSLAKSYQQVASMFVLLSQIRAFRGLMKVPAAYAGK